MLQLLQSLDSWNCAFSDCGTLYPLDFGYADFAGKETTYEQKVPVVCEVGYGLEGDPEITCLEDGTWSKNTICAIKSNCSFFFFLTNSINFSDLKKENFRFRI